jgi:hypothetical protein
MRNKCKKRAEKALRCVPSDIQALLGDPPLLTTEDPNLYWEMLDRFAEFVEPRNIIEWLWLKDIADLSWEINRLRRYRAMIIENEREERNAEIEYAREHADDPAVYPSRMSAEEIEERENAPRLDTEADSANLLCALLGRYEELDKLLISAELRRDRILRELDLRRERIAPLLRSASDQMIEDHSQEITLAPK